LPDRNQMQQRGEETQRIGAARGLPSRVMETRPLTGMGRRFADLRVRPKLMVLHNAFFLLLACLIYFSLVSLVESRMQQARTREMTLILNAFSVHSPEAEQTALRPYELFSGTAGDFGLTDAAQDWMRRFPGRVWQRGPQSEHIYKLIPGANRYYRLTLPAAFYDDVVSSVKLALFIILGFIYVLAVLVLELVIMPLYVYQPLRLLLEADCATRIGDREAEIIGERFIPGDEIGQILRSHNATVRALRQHEDELEAAKRHLEAQDRLVSLGLLSASVAHEMNTPLAVLHGSIEKLMETVPEPHAQSRLARMVRVTERLRRISAGLLDFARLRSAALESVALRPIVDEAWHLVSIDEKSSDVVFQNDVDPRHTALANADRLVQVFVNLLRNALLAVPAGRGRIRAASIATVAGGRPSIAVTVEDNGPGIPQEVLPEVFEAFVTTRLDAQGTGLGLTVVEGIVTQFGGSISASNLPDGGASLEVVLPSPTEQSHER
jgi:C4-dicarboxylate-specific signal transduction histidine kinase